MGFCCCLSSSTGSKNLADRSRLVTAQTLVLKAPLFSFVSTARGPVFREFIGKLSRVAHCSLFGRNKWHSIPTCCTEKLNVSLQLKCACGWTLAAVVSFSRGYLGTSLNTPLVSGAAASCSKKHSVAQLCKRIWVESFRIVTKLCSFVWVNLCADRQPVNHYHSESTERKTWNPKFASQSSLSSNRA